MPIFKEIKKNISQATSNNLNGPKDMADTSRFNPQIADEQKQFNSFFMQAWKNHDERYSDAADGTFSPLCISISECIARITSLFVEIKSIKKCLSCKIKVPVACLCSIAILVFASGCEAGNRLDSSNAVPSASLTYSPPPSFSILEITQEPPIPSEQTPSLDTVTPSQIPASPSYASDDELADEKITTRLPLENFVIGLDPGHQLHANNQPEPISPSSSKKKKKVSSGTQGKWTRTPEYEVNLAVGLLLYDLLVEQGATVIMTRETNDVDISNVERAELFNQSNTDYALRLHCNGSDNSDKHGAFMLIPKTNPFDKECREAAETLIDAYCEATGAKNLGITIRDDQTGFNWCDRMIINVEMGHMTNKEEDYLLSDPVYQQKMAQGLCDGILRYFENKY